MPCYYKDDYSLAGRNGQIADQMYRSDVTSDGVSLPAPLVNGGADLLLSMVVASLMRSSNQDGAWISWIEM